MQKRFVGAAWKVALALVALAATTMAFYVQIFERSSWREEDRLWAARLEAVIEESRARVETEVLAQVRAELAKEESAGSPGDRPLPGAVLRRGESGGGRALQQALPQESEEAVLARLQASLAGVTSEMESSDRALRRGLEDLRMEVRRERDADGKTLGLVLVALIPLVVHLLASLRPEGAFLRNREEP